MGQKSNPNSFNHAYYKTTFSSFSNMIEYNINFKEFIEIKKSFYSLFEKNFFIVKNIRLIKLATSNQVIFYLSFLPLLDLKAVDKKNNLRDFTSFSKKHPFIFFKTKETFRSLFETRFPGYKIKLVFFNLQKILFPSPILDIKRIRRNTFRFNREKFFRCGNLLLVLSSQLNDLAPLIAKFIKIFIIKYHRDARSMRKFFSFLNILVRMLSRRFLGLKIEVKGRFKKSGRSKRRRIKLGRLPLQTITSKIFYSFESVVTSYGVFGVKVWVNQKKNYVTSTKKNKI